jgi:hypothetical protein
VKFNLVSGNGGLAWKEYEHAVERGSVGTPPDRDDSPWEDTVGGGDSGTPVDRYDTPFCMDRSFR